MKTDNYPVEYLLRLSWEQADDIDTYRYANRIPSAAAALRKLLDLGIEAAKRQAEGE